MKHTAARYLDGRSVLRSTAQPRSGALGATVVGHWLPATGAVLLSTAWHTGRIVLCVLLVLLEPLGRILLVPLAYLTFLVTLLFGFVLHAPNFPRWGMLVFAIALFLLYWAFLGVMSLFMRLPDRS